MNNVGYLKINSNFLFLQKRITMILPFEKDS